MISDSVARLTIFARKMSSICRIFGAVFGVGAYFHQHEFARDGLAFLEIDARRRR